MCKVFLKIRVNLYCYILDFRTHQDLFVSILNLDLICFPLPFLNHWGFVWSLLAYCFTVLFAFFFVFSVSNSSPSPHAVSFVTSWTGWVWLLRTWWRGPASSSTDLISTATRYGLMIGRREEDCGFLLFNNFFLSFCRRWGFAQIVDDERCHLFIYLFLSSPTVVRMHTVLDSGKAMGR